MSTTTSNRWDPSETLELDLGSWAFTCIGYAATRGRRCRNRIAESNELAASGILDNLARISPTSRRVENMLLDLASCLLCRRWHQDQAMSLVEKWLSIIEELPPPPPPTRPVVRRRVAPRPPETPRPPTPPRRLERPPASEQGRAATVQSTSGLSTPNTARSDRPRPALNRGAVTIQSTPGLSTPVTLSSDRPRPSRNRGAANVPSISASRAPIPAWLADVRTPDDSGASTVPSVSALQTPSTTRSGRSRAPANSNNTDRTAINTEPASASRTPDPATVQVNVADLQELARIGAIASELLRSAERPSEEPTIRVDMRTNIEIRGHRTLRASQSLVINNGTPAISSNATPRLRTPSFSDNNSTDDADPPPPPDVIITPVDLIHRLSQVHDSIEAHHFATVPDDDSPKLIQDECPICPICYDDLGTDDLVWCQAECGQNFHRSCNDAWIAERPREPKCAYCRAVWVKDEE